MNDYFMDLAYDEAKKAFENGEIPVGCVIVKNNCIIARAHNCKESEKNSIMHAELMAVDRACRVVGDWRLDNCILYTTLEPCMMCLGAIIESRISTVYYGTNSKCKQMFDIDKIKFKKISIVNVHDNRCSLILSDFFKNKRKN